ncbi:hypothetical protein ATANTOWER_018792 [Ataeniobius toweri]|uniref:Uncharacterized protein n=1 Tax=Ataeniobius toweri TaxID=208326 RepID=A0ABU7AC72_9TELE|nr:hypothetical protein [Ataeniobius toweri]
MLKMLSLVKRKLDNSKWRFFKTQFEIYETFITCIFSGRTNLKEPNLPRKEGICARSFFRPANQQCTATGGEGVPYFTPYSVQPQKVLVTPAISVESHYWL